MEDQERIEEQEDVEAHRPKKVLGEGEEPTDELAESDDDVEAHRARKSQL